MRVLLSTRCVRWRVQEAEEQRVADEAELQAWAADAPAVLAAVLAASPALEDPVAKVPDHSSSLSHRAVNICIGAAWLLSKD